MKIAADRRARRRYLRMLIRMHKRSQCPRCRGYLFRRDYLKHLSRGDCRKALKALKDNRS